VEPVYAALITNGEDAGLAAELFERSRTGYHPLTVAAIEKHFEGTAAEAR
jgi:hypothetical protein